MSGFLKHLSRHPPLPQTLFAFEIKLLNEMGLQPDFKKDKVGPDLEQILRILLVGDWSTLPRLKLTPPQITSLRQFLQGFLIYHLGKTPASRHRPTR
jgi:recombinational DNA repair protein (RecF pathway)